MHARASSQAAVLLTAPILTVLASPGLAQSSCRSWSEEFSAPGVDGSVLAMHVWDDGSGPALYMGGGNFQTAGDGVVNAIVRWDGSSWTGLSGPAGTGFTSSSYNTVRALLDFDDGSGPALYATGLFWEAGGVSVASVARFDGSAWSDVGGGIGPGGYSALSGSDLEVYDDGSGEALYLAGGFLYAGAETVQGLARWDGTAWSSVGGESFHISVQAIEPFDDGGGERLFVAGGFEIQWGSPADYIACWDGADWSGLSTLRGPNAYVLALQTFDDGSGEALFVGGAFTFAGGAAGDHAMKWDGITWTPLGAGPGFQVFDFQLFDDGSTEALYAVGAGLARWDGASWTAVGDGLNASGYVLEPFDAGAGEQLFAGGLFTRAGSDPAWGVATLNGSSWEPLATGLGTLNVPLDMVEFDDGAGTRLYANVQLGPEDGGVSVAAWDGTQWTPLGDPFDDEVHTLCVFDDGSGAKLHAGGRFDAVGPVAASKVARWSGTSWEALGSGLDGTVASMTVYDDGSGPALILGGRFKWAGAVNVKHVAAWDGTSWSPLGAGLGGSGVKWAFDLEVYDDGLGGGPALFVAGQFDLAGGVPALNIARWNGTSWSALGAGLNKRVNALQVHDDGSGLALFAGGDFWGAGIGTATRRVAKWNGVTWATVGTPGNELFGEVNDLAVMNLGWGAELVAVGDFVASTGSPGNFVATWDGALWSPLPVEPDDGVLCAAVHDDGTGAGPSLFLGGQFELFGATPSLRVGKWSVECPCPPAAYCTAKLNSQGCTPSIFATGSPSISAGTLRVKAANVLNNKTGLLFWGHTTSSTPFQGGTKCVAAPTVRTPVQQSGGNPPPDDCSGLYSFHWNKPYLQSRGLMAGDTVHCQYWSRDPQSGSTTGLTDGLTVTLCP